MVISENITGKNYKKLSLQVTLNGISFCVFDTLNNKVLFVKEIEFSVSTKSSVVEDNYKKVFTENPELKDFYDEILVLHDNNLDTFVPNALFDEDFLGSYLQYNTKVFETDFFAFDLLSSCDTNHVYIPFVNINNYLLDQYTSFNYKHVNSILVSKIVDISKNIDETQVFVHFSNDKFEIIIVQNQNLLLFNSFDYVTKEDFIYYLLFSIEQLKLNPEYLKVSLLGSITMQSELYQIAYKYIRNVSLLDVSGLQKHNDFSTVQNLKHFILFQS